MAAAGEKEGARGCPRSPCLWPRAGEVREVVGPRGLCVSHTPGIRTFGRHRQSPKRAGPFHSLRHSPAGWSAPGRVQALAVREPAVPATSPGSVGSSRRGLVQPPAASDGRRPLPHGDARSQGSLCRRVRQHSGLSRAPLAEVGSPLRAGQGWAWEEAGSSVRWLDLADLAEAGSSAGRAMILRPVLCSRAGGLTQPTWVPSRRPRPS